MRTSMNHSDAGQRKAAVFNERFPVGTLVAVRRVPGEAASWDRIFAPAYPWGDDAVVELASSLMPVDTDIVISMDTAPAVAWQEAARAYEETPPRCPEARRINAWPVACGFVLGIATAVLLAFSQPVPRAMHTDCAPETTADSGETE